MARPWGMVRSGGAEHQKGYAKRKRIMLKQWEKRRTYEPMNLRTFYAKRYKKNWKLADTATSAPSEPSEPSEPFQTTNNKQQTMHIHKRQLSMLCV